MRRELKTITHVVILSLQFFREYPFATLIILVAIPTMVTTVFRTLTAKTTTPLLAPFPSMEV